jgi:glycosyltransferase involved in cell wall biosynthesis
MANSTLTTVVSMSEVAVKKPAISVVVEGYNESRDLGTADETMAALKQQDFPLDQIEVILVGSPSQTQEWQQTYAGETGFCSVRTLEFNGAHYYELKNGGAGIATGNIIAFTDSDVHPRPTWARAIVTGIHNGADVVAGPTLFRDAGGLPPDSPLMRACASITWGWVVGKGKQGEFLSAVGFMDHNVAMRAEVFRQHQYRTDLGRVIASPLLYRLLANAGLLVAIQPQQQATHFFSWRYWLRLHFRYGYEVFHIRRLDSQYPNQWIRKAGVLEPLATMIWHILLDIPRWFRFNRILAIHPFYCWLTLPVLILPATLARGSEMLGMYATMMSPKTLKQWAENF